MASHRFLLVSLFLVASPSSARVTPSPSDVCHAVKLKAAGKRASDAFAAYAKNLTAPNDAQLNAALAKAEAKFTSAFAKIESSGACDTKGDAPRISGTLDQCVALVRGFTDIVFTGESVSTPFGSATVNGAIPVSQDGTLMRGEVTVAFGNGGMASLTPLGDGSIQIRVGSNTLLLLPDGGLFLNTAPVAIDDFFNTFATDAQSGRDPTQWSPLSQCILAFLSVSSTTSWRSNIQAAISTQASVSLRACNF